MNTIQDEQIEALNNQLNDKCHEIFQLKLKLAHVGDFATDVNIDSLDRAPAETGSVLHSKELDDVVEVVRMLQGAISDLRASKAQLDAKNQELRADIEQKRLVMSSQAKEIERLAAQVHTVVGGLKRRHDAIETVLRYDNPDEELNGEQMSEETQQLLGHILRIANVG